MWGQPRNTTNELPGQATSAPSRCWCPQMPKIVRVALLLAVISQRVATVINMGFTFSSPAKETMLRSISSAPCFAGAHLQQPLCSHLTPSVLPLPLLPHSRSTGNLCVPSLSSSLLPLHPLNAEGGNCQWTVGLGWARRIHLPKMAKNDFKKVFYCLLGLNSDIFCFCVFGAFGWLSISYESNSKCESMALLATIECRGDPYLYGVLVYEVLHNLIIYPNDIWCTGRELLNAHV